MIPSTKLGIVIPTLVREREEDCLAKASFGYGTHSRPAWATQKHDFQRKKKERKEKKKRLKDTELKFLKCTKTYVTS